MAKGREVVGGFRVGKYTVNQVPLNVTVTELRLVATGINAGMEVPVEATKTFHRNYGQALGNLLDRLIADGCASSTKSSIIGVKDSIKNARADILEAIDAQGLR